MTPILLTAYVLAWPVIVAFVQLVGGAWVLQDKALALLGYDLAELGLDFGGVRGLGVSVDLESAVD